MVSRNAEGNLDSCRRFAIGRKSRSRSSRKEQEPRWEGIHPARAFLRMIGQSNRQTLPQRAGVCFQSFMLPQCANVPYCAEKLNRLGYKSAEGTQRRLFVGQTRNQEHSVATVCFPQIIPDVAVFLA
jgi:hypothetical protein